MLIAILALAGMLVSAVSLEMKVAVVEQSTSVTASSDAVGTQEQAGTNTVAEQAVKDMPTLNERFEDLLPLIPGVVPGPWADQHERRPLIPERVARQ